MPYVYSTCSSDVAFPVEVESTGAGGANFIKRKVLIKGGANIANKKTLVTPMGVATEISDEELSLLQKNETFQRRMKAGFFVVDSKKTDAEKVAKDMKKKDKSAQITPADEAPKAE
jgi:rRNA maturation endonuclease Nob1